MGLAAELLCLCDHTERIWRSWVSAVLPASAWVGFFGFFRSSASSPPLPVFTFVAVVAEATLDSAVEANGTGLRRGASAATSGSADPDNEHDESRVPGAPCAVRSSCHAPHGCVERHG